MTPNFAHTIAFRVYLFDEDAYFAYINFFKKLENHFSLYENSQIKLDDIQYVIADFFDSKLKDETRNLHLHEIDNLISFLGSETKWDKHYQHNTNVNSGPKGKKFKRLLEGSFLAGIFSGCADLFGIHALYFRIVFVLLCIPFQALIAVYIILWIFLPISEKKHIYILDENKMSNKIAKWSTNIFGKISGFLIILLSILSFCCVLFFTYLYAEKLTFWYQTIGLGSNNEKLLWISTILILSIPCLLLFLFGTRLIIGRAYKIKIWRFNFILWGASVAIFIFVAFQLISNLNQTQKNKLVEKYRIHNELTFITDYPKENEIENLHNLSLNFFIEETDSFKIVKNISASGRTLEDAKIELEKMHYDVKYTNDTVFIKHDFSINNKNLFKAQEVQIDFYIPQNTKLTITNFSKKYISFKKNSIYKTENNLIENLPKYQELLFLIAEEKGFKIL